MVSRTRKSGRNRTRKTSAWSRRLSRFTSRFPRLLRTNLWSSKAANELWQSLFGAKKKPGAKTRRKSDASAKAPARRSTRYRKPSSLQVETLEARQLLTTNTIALWNFNSTVPDAAVATGVSTPALGTGTASLIGGVSATFATGSSTDAAAAGTDNSAWNLTTFAAQSTGNLTRGVEFATPLTGFAVGDHLVVGFDLRQSNTASAFYQLQFSSDGTSFANVSGGSGTFTTTTGNTTAFNGSGLFSNTTTTNNFVTGIQYDLPIGAGSLFLNTANFKFRLLAAFNPTPGTSYTAANGSYATNGTLRIDTVSILDVKPDTAPTVSNPSSTSVTTNSAVLGGTLDSNGGSPITSYGVVYSTDSNVATGNTTVSQSGAPGAAAFTVSVSGLAAHTHYFFKAFATNAVGTTLTSTIGSFTTGNTAAVVNSDNGSVTVTAGTQATMTGTYNGPTDPDGDGVTLSASVGTVISTGVGTWSWSYTPATTSDAQTVTITANDGQGLSTTQFTLNVNAANAAPTDINLAGGSVNENAPIHTAVGTFTTVDADDTTGFTYVFVTGAGDTDNGKFILAGTGGDTLATNDTFNFEAQQTYTVRIKSTDPHGASTEKSFTININNVNDVASITGSATGAVQEDGTLAANGDLDVSDQDAGEASFQTPPSLAGTYGTFTFAPATGIWSYALNNGATNVQSLKGGQSVSDSLTVTSVDGTATQAITVTITGANDTPTLSADVRNLTETNLAADISSTGTLTVSDTDTGESSYQAASLTGTYGNLVLGTNGAWTYTANSAHNELAAGQIVSDVFTVKSFDNTTTTVTINITGTNDPASLGSANVSLTEGDSAADLTTGGALSISDIDSSATFIPQSNTVGAYGLFSINAGGNWSYIASSAHDEFGAGSIQQELFSVASADGTLTLVQLNLAGTNDAAGAIGGTITGSVAEDGTLAASGTASVSDVDNPSNKFLAVAPAALAGTYGTFTFDESSGAWTYALTNSAAAVQALKAAQVVHDKLLITSLDGTSTAFIDISITGNNDPATLGGDNVGSVTEEGPLTDLGTLTAIDTDTGESSFQPAAGSTAHGSFTLLANGDWTYALNNADAAVQALNTGDTLADSFTATSVDGSTISVSITIHGLDENPTVATVNAGAGNNTLTIDFDAGTYQVDGGTPQTLSGLLTLNFNGQGGTDAIVIHGGGGTQTYSYGAAGVDGNSGSIVINGLTINYTGLEPITNTGTPTDVEFILTAGADNATLKSLGGGNYELSGAGFETTSFSITGLNSLTIRGSGGSDSITIQDAISVPTITLDFETITLQADITATTLNGAANTSTVNVQVGAEIQDAVTLIAPNGTINVAAGTYHQDVNVNKSGVKLLGAGFATTTLSGAIGGIGSTVAASASDVEIAGFTITRDGNNTTDWNNPNLNTVGISIQGLAISGVLIHDNSFVGNRTGIDVNNSSGHTIRNNKINDNRTGMIFRNQTDGMTVTENEIQNNWTVGIVFLDGSVGTNVPVQTAANSSFTNNSFSGNWYGAIVDRQTGGSLPAPGGSLKNFSGNWFGTATPVITTANSAEPGYAAQIPVVYGGTATNPGGAPDIAGPASANFDISPLLIVGTDTSATFGFQGDFSTVEVTTAGAQTGAAGKIQEGINVVNGGGTVKILAGAYSGNVSATSKAVTLSPGASPAQVTINGNLALDGNDTLAIEITGTNPATQYDNLVVNGTVALGGATLALSGAYVPVPGNSFTIVDNDGTSDGNGAFGGLSEGSVIIFNGKPLKLSYVGGDGNNVTLSIPVPTDVWVNDTWIVTSDVGPTGLSTGDTVMSNTGAGDTAVSGLVFGYDAFSNVSPALAAVAGSGTVHVLAGSYLQSSGSVGLSVAQNVSIVGQGDGVVTIDSNGAFTGIEVPAGAFAVNISGITLSNFTSTGIHALGNLNVSNSTVSGGFVGVWADGASSNLDLTSSIVTGSMIFGVQVSSGADADITTSEIVGSGTTAASVIVSGGHADILDSRLTGSNRGLLVNATGTASVHNSNLTGNTVRAIDNASANIVDASSNWFGTNSEAGVQAQTLGLVDFTPFLDVGTDTDAGARGFAGDLSHLHVTALGQQTGSTGRISEGVSLVADGALIGGNRIVDVHAGTFAEQVLVNQPVKLLGARAGADARTRSGGGESIVVPSISNPDPFSAGAVTVLEINANDVTVDGFTIDGDDTSLADSGVHSGGASIDAATGIGSYTFGSGLRIRNNIVKNLTYTGLDFENFFSGNASSDNILSQNYISNLGDDAGFGFGLGVLVGTNFYADVINNRIEGVRVGLQTDNYYKANPGATGSISNNSFSARRAGIWNNLSYTAASPLTISGNTVAAESDATISRFSGIWVTSIADGAAPTISGNTVTVGAIAQLQSSGYEFWNDTAPGGVTISGGSVSGAKYGVWVNNFDSYPTATGSNGGSTSVTVSGLAITGAAIGVYVKDNPSNSNGATVHANVTNNTSITGTGSSTGILVEGSDASASITNNLASIHGNSIGIDVNGGTATITANHIYGNTLYGIRFTNGGQGNVDDNDFEGGADPDNGTDLRLDATAGGIIGGTLTGNTFAGATYIDQRDSQDLTALRIGSVNPLDNNTYKRDNSTVETNDFNIEGRIFHKPDNAASGLVTWVANTIFVTPATSPTASDNDYTRIKNAIEGASNGTTIALQGTFDWTEANAAASWANGNDGLPGTTLDNYSILVPTNLNNVTFTAPGGLGSATIHGPGDLLNVDLEGVFFFNGGDNKGWTISNMRFEDFDLTIGMFFGAGGTDAYDNTTITNNYIRVPVDLNATAAPLDVSQNIGIHYAFGKNQTISNNTIEIAGGGLSDGSNFSSSVGMQSNTSGGDAYDGLLITGNTINVTGTLAAQPSNILGIWENGHAHNSDITVSNNQFHNLTGNNANTNLMRAFRVTSHSTGGVTPTTVTYSGNTVDGANIGFQWIAGSNFTGQAPVEVIGNTLTNVGTGFLIQSNGVAHLSDNSLTNSGYMLHVGTGIDVAAGSVVTINDSTDDNDIVGFDTAIRSAGTVTVSGNNNSIHGNLIGIDVTGGSATISGNHIYDNTTGIRFTGTGGGSVTGNNFNDSADNATDLRIDSGVGAVTIGAGNSFAGDTFYIDNRSTQSFNISAAVSNAQTFDLANNFRIEDKMFHRVDSGNTSAGLITWVDKNVYVTNPLIAPTSTDSSIQLGVDAVPVAPGWTVNVEDGTYVEQVGIAKDLTLLGQSQAGTIIQSPASLSLGNSFVYGGLTRQSVVAVTAGNVTIQNLTVDGNGAGSTVVPGNDFHGIGIHNSDVTVSGVTVKGVRDATLSGAQRGRAIFAGNDTGTHTVNVTGSTVTDYQKNGIDMRGTGLTSNITNNVITGVGPTNVIAQNGIVFVGGSPNNVTGNTIKGHNYTGVDDAAGILMIGTTGTANVSGNFLGQGSASDGNELGVYTDSTASIIGNTITNSSTTGIFADGAAAKVKIQGNTLSGNQVGIHVEGGAIVDAGSTAGDGDPTGLGTSTGGNILTGYTGTSGNYAIEDLNLAAQADVLAKFNNFGPYVNISIIENYVFDDTDDPTRSEVIFTGALNQQAAPSVVYVDDNWAGTPLGNDADGAGNVVPNWTGIGGNANGTSFGVDEFATIQDALNAVAAGGSIYVYSGNYAQQLTISQAVSLFGFQAGNDARAARGAESVIKANAVGDALVEVNAGLVTIDGFTVDGNGQAYRDIRVNEVDGAHVVNNIITGAVRGVQYNGAAGGNSGGLVQFNKIQSLTASGDGSYGVVAFDSSYASVKDNTMTGLDVGIFEQYFYQPNAGNAANVISGNVITAALLGYGTNERSAAASVTQLSGNTYHIGAGGVGVQLYNIYKSGGITLTNETIDGAASVGIYAFISGGSVSVTGGSITSTAGSIGVHATNYLTDFGYAATGNGDITLDSVDISNFAVGVKVEDDPLGAFNIHATITNDTDITGATTAGILVTGADASADITNNDNSIHGNAIGIQVVGGSANVTNNEIHDNGQGVVLTGGSATLLNNHIHNNGSGINVTGASTLNLTGGVIENNTGNGLAVTGDGTAKQTIIVNGTTFSANSTGQPVSSGFGDITLFAFAGPVGNMSVASFTNVTVNSVSPDYAIQVRGLNGDIATNGLALNPGKTADVTFDGVQINGTQQRYAMLIQQYADLSTFHFNGTGVEFNSTALGGLVIFDAGGSLNLGSSKFHNTYARGGAASGTGWDIVTSLTNINATGVTFLNASNVALDKTVLADNFAIEDRVAHAVDAPAPAGTALVDWVGSGPYDNAVFVTTNSFVLPLTTAASVQRGINVASAGWTVYANSGTYTGQLDITKNLTLQGVGNSTIIKAPATFTPTNNFTFNGTTRESVIAVRGVANATIRNLKVDGDGRGNSVVSGDDFHGIGMYNSNVTVDTVTVVGVRDALLSGAQRGRAIFGANDSGTHTINVTGSTVSDYQKNGIDMRGTGLTSNITNNVITGVGNTGLIAQNGIVFVGGSPNNVTGNTIKGHQYSGADGAVAILILGTTGTANVSGNFIGQGTAADGNEVGVYTDSKASILNNTITNSGIAGVEVDGGTALLQGNTLNGNTIGLLVEGAAIVDAGQAGKPTTSNFTGLGISTGGNDFSGYTVAATATSGAIVDLKPDAVAGRQNPPADVTAYGNTWATPTANGIENVVWHDTDVSTLGFVDFAAFGNLVVTPTTPTTINEGSSVGISGSFSNVPQPHTVTIVWGDSSPNTVLLLPAGTFTFSSSHTYVDNTNGTAFSTHPITVTVTDASATNIGPSAPINVTVNNTPPVVVLAGPTGAGTGQTKHYTFTTADLGDDNHTPGQLSLVGAGVTLTPSGGASASLVGPVVFDPVTGDGSFDVLFTSLPGGGSVAVTITVQDDDGAQDSDTLNVGVGNTLQVTSFTPTASGFDVTFNRSPNLADLNLYDGLDAAVETPDVILHASSAAPGVNVRGSLVWIASTNTLRFVATGGILANDLLGYSVTLVSGASAFHDAFGKLDGDGDFNDTEIPDNYTNSFAVAVPAGTRVVSVKDFARGPGQHVDDNPAVILSRLAVSVSDATAVRAVDFHFHYDPTQLSIVGASLGATVPNDWIITFSNSISGEFIVTASGITPLSGSNVPVVLIDANVPNSAAFGNSDAVFFSDLVVKVEQPGPIVVTTPSIGDLAVHKTAYLGDVDGSGKYTGFDAALISRVAAGLESGFDAHDWTDPRIVGDADGDGLIGGGDAAVVAQKSVGITTPQLPNIPNLVLTPVGGGIDPQLSVPDGLLINACALAVPVYIDIPGSELVYGTTFTLTYDSTKFDFEGAMRGSFWTQAGNWALVANESSPGVVTVTMFNSQGNASPATPSGSPQDIATVVLHVHQDAPIGSYALNVQSVDPNDGGVAWTRDNGSANVTHSPAYLSGDANGDFAVNFGDYLVLLNHYGQTGLNVPGDLDCSGAVNFGDYLILLNNYGTSLPGSGSGSSVEDEFFAGSSSQSEAPVALAAVNSAPVNPSLNESEPEVVAASAVSKSVVASSTAVAPSVTTESSLLSSSFVIATLTEGDTSESTSSATLSSVDETLAVEAPVLQLAASRVDHAFDSFDSDRTCRFTSSDVADEVVEDAFLEWANA
jgi:VCBS repeat-containing protein